MTLPNRQDPNFPVALKKAREARGISYSELARAIGIHAVMPSRYENPNHSCFGIPSQDTWIKLNEFFESSKVPQEPVKEEKAPLSPYTVDELIAEIKRRGASSVQISY